MPAFSGSHPAPPPPDTARLRLRRFVPGDLDALAAMYAKPTTMRFLNQGQPRTREETAELLGRILASWERDGFGYLAVEPAGGGPLLGRAGLKPLEDTPEMELGYLFDDTCWNRGYATEASEALLRWGFETLELSHVVAVADPDNHASLRVIQKLGMRPDGRAFHYGGEVLRHVLTREAWLATRSEPPRWNDSGTNGK